MVERALDADERVQLQVFRAATEPNAPLYAAVLSLLVTAKERYQVQVRTEDIAQELSAAGWEVATLTATLEPVSYTHLGPAHHQFLLPVPVEVGGGGGGKHAVGTEERPAGQDRPRCGVKSEGVLVQRTGEDVRGA